MPRLTRGYLGELVDLVRLDPLNQGIDLRARIIARDLPPDVARKIAAEYLTERVRMILRAETRLVERDASQPRTLHEAASIARGRTVGWTPDQIAASEAAVAIIDEDSLTRTYSEVAAIIEGFRTACRVEWTDELMQSGFSLPDGTVTTWGTATLAQHQARVTMFTRNAAANLEGAARHSQAIGQLQEAGVDTLSDLMNLRS